MGEAEREENYSTLFIYVDGLNFFFIFLVPAVFRAHLTFSLCHIFFFLSHSRQLADDQKLAIDELQKRLQALSEETKAELEAQSK